MKPIDDAYQLQMGDLCETSSGAVAQAAKAAHSRLASPSAQQPSAAVTVSQCLHEGAYDVNPCRPCQRIPPMRGGMHFSAPGSPDTVNLRNRLAQLGGAIDKCESPQRWLFVVHQIVGTKADSLLFVVWKVCGGTSSIVKVKARSK